MNKPEIVCDTSVLLYLGRINYPHLLPALFETVAVPEIVMLELDVGRLQRPDTIDPRTVEWVMSVEVAPSEINTLPPNRLGRGERTVIGYAHVHKACLAGLDDLQARLFAEGLGIKVIGTIGILIKAKLTGVVPSIRELLQNLQNEGFHLSSEVYQEALRLVGEEKR
jgi:predicted nucleic acid-binding protein